jgi:hypothetical protein
LDLEGERLDRSGPGAKIDLTSATDFNNVRGRRRIDRPQAFSIDGKAVK